MSSVANLKKQPEHVIEQTKKLENKIKGLNKVEALKYLRSNEVDANE